MGKLEVAMTALAEAQQRSTVRLGDLQVAVGSLANTFGFSLEEFTAALLPPFLLRHYSLAVSDLERRFFDLPDGTGVSG
jgi:hypothetical protein